MNAPSSKKGAASRDAPKIDAEMEETIYQWVKLAMDSRTEEEVKWEEENFPDIDTLEVGRARLRAQIWGTPENAEGEEEHRPKNKGKQRVPIHPANGEGEEEHQPKSKGKERAPIHPANGEREEEEQPKKNGKGHAPTQPEGMEKDQTSTRAVNFATGNHVPGESYFNSKEQKHLMAQMAGHTVHVEGMICINAEEQPEMAAAFEALAAGHGWKPTLPARIGHVEFRAVWDLDFTISVAAYSDLFELIAASDPGNSMSEVDLGSREKPCCEIQLGPKHAPFFHFVQAYLRMHLEYDALLNEIWTIPSRYGRAECIIRNLVYIGNLIGDSEEFAYLNLYVNQLWDTLRTWGFCYREMDLEPDGYKNDLLFHSQKQFRALYDAAQGTALRFFAIETVEHTLIDAAHYAAVTLPEWIEEDFLNHANPDTAMFRDDLRELRDLCLRRHRASKLTLPWPKYYTPRPDLAVPKPFEPLSERHLQPPNGDPELEAQPWLARAGRIPSAKEVRKTIEALSQTPGKEDT